MEIAIVLENEDEILKIEKQISEAILAKLDPSGALKSRLAESVKTDVTKIAMQYFSFPRIYLGFNLETHALRLLTVDEYKGMTEEADVPDIQNPFIAVVTQDPDKRVNLQVRDKVLEILRNAKRPMSGSEVTDLCPEFDGALVYREMRRAAERKELKWDEMLRWVPNDPAHHLGTVYLTCETLSPKQVYDKVVEVVRNSAYPLTLDEVLSKVPGVESTVICKELDRAVADRILQNRDDRWVAKTYLVLAKDSSGYSWLSSYGKAATQIPWVPEEDEVARKKALNVSWSRPPHCCHISKIVRGKSRVTCTWHTKDGGSVSAWLNLGISKVGLPVLHAYQWYVCHDGRQGYPYPASYVDQEVGKRVDTQGGLV